MQLVCVHRRRVRVFPAAQCIAFYLTTTHLHVTQISSTPASLFPTKPANQRCRRTSMQPRVGTSDDERGQSALSAVIHAGSTPFGERRSLWNAHVWMVDHVCALCVCVCVCWRGGAGGSFVCVCCLWQMHKRCSGSREHLGRLRHQVYL